MIADAVPTVVAWTSSRGPAPTRSSAKRLCYAESVLEFREELEGISVVTQDEIPAPSTSLRAGSVSPKSRRDKGRAPSGKTGPAPGDGADFGCIISLR